jgi:hypothetical protein
MCSWLFYQLFDLSPSITRRTTTYQELFRAPTLHLHLEPPGCLFTPSMTAFQDIDIDTDEWCWWEWKNRRRVKKARRRRCDRVTLPRPRDLSVDTSCTLLDPRLRLPPACPSQRPAQGTPAYSILVMRVLFVL